MGRLGRSVVFLLGVLLAGQLAATELDSSIASVERLLEEGNASQALEQLRGLKPRDDRSTAQLFLLRSTARFMLGQIELGQRDLDAALKRDPELRQAWLNKAGLDISEGRLDDALAALERARELDPEAADNDLNIGALLAMQGRVDEAHPYLQRYLTTNPDDADAWYLVASNYALAGDAKRAVEHLSQAIAMNERTRLRSRTDPNFLALSEDASFRQLLASDSYRIPAGSHAIYQVFDSPYLAGRGKLLPAVLDALQLSGEPFDRKIEVAPDWALIWGEVRIRLRDDDRQGGRVEVTASRDHFGESQFRARVDRLFAEIAVQLAKR